MNSGKQTVSTTHVIPLTIVPEVSNDENDDMIVENENPRGGKYNLRPNPTPNFTDEYRY